MHHARVQVCESPSGPRVTKVEREVEEEECGEAMAHGDRLPRPRVRGEGEGKAEGEAGESEGSPP